VHAVLACESDAAMGQREGEHHMRRSLEIEASERIVLGCGCGERLVLLGREDDWYAEGRDAFECECGEKLTLANRVERGSSVADLIRGPAFLDGR
jgi:hypothetical protein